MFISEVMKTCGLTKKAINYYEQQGLLALQYDHNGCRKFEEKGPQEKLQAANERFLAEYADTFFPSEQ